MTAEPLDAAVARFQTILGKFEGGVLSTNNPRVPDSLTYHLCDIYLDELEKVLEAVHDAANENAEADEEKDEEKEEELPLVPTMELLLPFVDALATAKSKAMYERIWSNVFDPLLQDTLRASARDGDDELSELASDASDAEEDDDDDDFDPPVMKSAQLSDLCDFLLPKFSSGEASLANYIYQLKGRDYSFSVDSTDCS